MEDAKLKYSIFTLLFSQKAVESDLALVDLGSPCRCRGPGLEKDRRSAVRVPRHGSTQTRFRQRTGGSDRQVGDGDILSPGNTK